jgi:hypothetical protein
MSLEYDMHNQVVYAQCFGTLTNSQDYTSYSLTLYEQTVKELKLDKDVPLQSMVPIWHISLAFLYNQPILT